MRAAELNLVEVSDWADPRLADYADIRDQEMRADRSALDRGIFWAEGELVVRRLIASAFPVRSVLCTPTRLATIRDALDDLLPGTPVYVGNQALVNEAVGFNIHRGIIAAGDRIAIPHASRVVGHAAALVVLEDLRNHDNIGAVFRNTAALGARAGVLLSPSCSDPLYRKAIRVSMGHALTAPFARLAPWPRALEEVRAAGFTVIALTPDPTATAIDRVPMCARPALLLGTEGPGLSAPALAAADLRVRIPLVPGVDSLNVAVAAAIALHRLCPVTPPNPDSAVQ